MISEKRTLPTDSSRYKQKCLSDKGIVRYAVLTLAGCSNSRTGRAPHTGVAIDLAHGVFPHQPGIALRGTWLG